MIHVNIKELVSESKATNIIQDLLDALGISVGIQDAHGNLLMGKKGGNGKFPVELAGKVIGWVTGEEKASSVASLLSYLAEKELETESLADETLEKYREITLLYDIADKIAACLDTKEISRLIIKETLRRIPSDNMSVMLMNEGSGKLEILEACGREFSPKIRMGVGEGIAGDIFATGRSEIINDVTTDPRYVQGRNKIFATMCAPLKTKEGVIGVANISREKLGNGFTSGELKLFTAITSQAASAIENALLHIYKLKEERIRSNLERYIAPQLVKSIIESKKDISLDSTRCNITILFSDIRSFSTKCEKLTPEQIVGYLNEYFTSMAEIVFKHGGTLNKYVGDMIMAFFGAPTKFSDDAKRAVETAVEMQKTLKNIPDSWIRDNFHTGIGINTGEVVVGNIGSPKHMDYTTIGDEVNIAERLESIAKGGEILVTRNTYDVTKDLFSFEEYGNVPVKGRVKPVEVFKVLG